MSKVMCPAHPDAALIEDHRAGDVICEECGLVVGDRVIDVGNEWRNLPSDGNSGSNPDRVGAAENSLLSDSNNLSTSITPGSDLAKTHNRRKSSADKTMMTGIQDIANMADKLNIPKGIVDRANGILKQVRDKRALKGRRTTSIGAACLYVACRQEAVPRTFKEICAVSGRSKKEIGHCYKEIIKELEMSPELITTGDFMSRFSSMVGLCVSAEKVATSIARKAVENDIVPGRSPISVAAAAIYMASQATNDKKTLKEVGEVAGVADITIRQSYRLMYPKAAELFPENFKDINAIDHLPLL